MKFKQISFRFWVLLLVLLYLPNKHIVAQNCAATIPSDCGECFPSQCNMVCGGNFQEDGFLCYTTSPQPPSVPDILITGSLITQKICTKMPPFSAPNAIDDRYAAINGAARIRLKLNTPMIAVCSYKLSFFQEDGAFLIGQSATPSANCQTAIRVFGLVSGNLGSSTLIHSVSSASSNGWQLLTTTITPTQNFDILEIATGATIDPTSQYLLVDNVMLHRIKEVNISTALDIGSVDTKPCRGNKICVTYNITSNQASFTATTLSVGTITGATIVPMTGGFNSNGEITITKPGNLTLCLDVPTNSTGAITIPTFLRMKSNCQTCYDNYKCENITINPINKIYEVTKEVTKPDGNNEVEYTINVKVNCMKPGTFLYIKDPLSPSLTFLNNINITSNIPSSAVALNYNAQQHLLWQQINATPSNSEVNLTFKFRAKINSSCPDINNTVEVQFTDNSIQKNRNKNCKC